jgi:hypothetical protein
MAETIKVRVSLDFEVDKSAITNTERQAVEFVRESLVEVVAHYAKLTQDPTYVGPGVVVSIPEDSTNTVA